ncbi:MULTISPECIES: 2-oxoglutarate dehydrogenase complex dihydrolipoyllysine-residue succinyltransferase [unclassified Mesorhizobium]|uniref:2-oxoglutarate dehydrogenase complex dihydrolipoyllysine-residue succinyltransferase n=1 Tax=unclassified Mesorhizobium TaxID=325217 RepID=UPI00112A386B|nr:MULTISPECIES: 2-oxoglutarate dehydrogenase complex dihydrolipoyllysine-residue succinyltransferase [unclassified Mesorhizobium]MBZ9981664.1 2-oxoglutarate dehydrogenase complex dihydrolipoyllysine-residue succinyltransferase [Mesorhizobium sp. BR-1-1-8]TPL37846.1 2-oxoglutarate dehydrogenase complex dihydrolipoyllysine-residue succinyltransferase [Mesorhizobium sp. B2-4-8]TPL69912.1 2-oxoglutarate dehydrogenase complex dihydrolipoyllysine-residue succinyltransferase [Mesorhizobium sp. B2-4-1]
MATEIRVPTLGESVTEATIGKWFKKVGDAIAADEPLVELETDKVTVEVPSPGAGTLGEIAAKEGETVGVGALLGSISAGAAAAPVTKPQAVAQASSPDAAQTTKQAAAETAKVAGDAGPVEPRSMPPAPAAAKLIAENNLSVDQLSGSGKRGQVLKGDVLDAISKGAPSQPAETPKAAPVSAAPVSARAPSSGDDAAREERVRMTKLRQTIARRLKEAQSTAAMLTTFNEVDMSAVMALRTKYKDVFEKKHGVKLGFMGFFTKAVTHALKEIPSVNAEIDATDIIFKNYAHIGVAVGTEKGLVVPVVRDADQMSIAEIEKEIGRLGIAARDGKLSVADMQGGTFTISNGGVYGSLMSTPILNAPQSGILGMHKIQDRPVVVGGQIVIRPMMYLALSYDHRIVDGKEAVTFLVRVKESLEDPERLVLDL